ncbi:MAG TPA: IS630 family transposase, partial [Hyphomicrobiaceae bacterium]
MAVAIELRADLSGDELRRLARGSRDAKQVRRLLAVAAILDGGTRTEAARVGGVGLQIVRDWVLRFNAEGPDGLIDRKAPGKAPTLTAEQRAALARIVGAGPEPWRDGVVRWRLIDLVQWLWEEFRVSVSAATVGRELRALGFRKLSARPRHYAQDRRRRTLSKKSPGARGGGPRRASRQAHRALVPGRGQDRPEEQAHPQVARRGTRPRAPHDQRTAWAYIFGAICPAEGKGAGLVMPFCDTEAMQEHLLEISGAVAPDAHAVLILDRAGWHLAGALVVPGNITLLPLPPRSLALNLVENVWQFLRDNFGSRTGSSRDTTTSSTIA